MADYSAEAKKPMTSQTIAGQGCSLCSQHELVRSMSSPSKEIPALNGPPGDLLFRRTANTACHPRIVLMYIINDLYWRHPFFEDPVTRIALIISPSV